MSKESKKKPPGHPEDRGGRWLLNLLIWFLVAPAAIVGSIATRYFYGIAFGVILALWRVWATPEITNYLAVKINWKGNKQAVQVQDSPGAQAIAVQGDDARINIEQSPSQTAKDLVETVYVPLLNEANSWIDPSKSTFTMGTWAELEHKAPHLLRLVPPDIRNAFKESQVVSSGISALTLMMFPIFRQAEMDAFQKLGITINSNYSYAGFGILQGEGVLDSVSIPKLWFSGKSLEAYANDFVSERYRGIDWGLDLRVDSRREGDKPKAIMFADEAFSYLEKNPTAREIREKYASLKSLGVKIRPLIDRELDKLVRLKT